MNNLSDEARKAQNDYMQEWRKNNRDKTKQAQQRYWEKKAREANKDDASEQAKGIATTK